VAPVLAQRPRADRAFERLYQRHVADVYRYSLAVLRNPADAEDVTQTTFLNAYRAYQRGERPDTPQNWLIKIAHNVCRQRFRTSARKPQEVAYDDDIGVAIVEHDEGPSAQDIQRALGELAFNQRAALVMRELEGRSYAEIGEILGLSLGAVETLIFRARRALREQLEGALSCHEAELAISKQLDSRLDRAGKGALRAHLRVCDDCATFARSQRAQRSALKALGAVPLPGSLASFFGGSAVGAGTIALKAGAVAAIFIAAGSVTSAGVNRMQAPDRFREAVSAASAPAPARSEPISRPVIVAQPVVEPAQTLAGEPLVTAPKSASRDGSAATNGHEHARGAGADAKSHANLGESRAQGQARGHAKQRAHARALAKANASSHAKARGRAYGTARTKPAHPPTARAARATPPQSQKPQDTTGNGNGNGNGNGGGNPEHKDKSLPVPTPPPVPQVTLPAPPADPLGELKKPKK
jgi:RNA polymerase sigma factor (sigma-70 family)